MTITEIKYIRVSRRSFNSNSCLYETLHPMPFYHKWKPISKVKVFNYLKRKG